MTPTARTRTLTLRAAQTGLVSGLGVAAAALLLPAGALPGSSSPAPAAASVEAQTASGPVAVDRPVPHGASRSRALAPKHLPMKRVTRTVPVGSSFSGQASWYGGSFDGQRTANGETFDTSDYTAASKTLAFGTRLRVCHDGCVVVRINDRGPYVGGRILDLSHAAARAIGFSGVAHVTATPVASRTVRVVDTAALARQRAHARHAALVARSHQLRALQQARAAAPAPEPVQAAAAEPTAPRTPVAAAGGALALASGGVLRRRRP